MEELRFSEADVTPTHITEQEKRTVGSLAVTRIVSGECPGGKQLGDSDCCSQPNNCQRLPFQSEQPLVEIPSLQREESGMIS